MRRAEGDPAGDRCNHLHLVSIPDRDLVKATCLADDAPRLDRVIAPTIGLPPALRLARYIRRKNPACSA